VLHGFIFFNSLCVPMRLLLAFSLFFLVKSIYKKLTGLYKLVESIFNFRKMTNITVYKDCTLGFKEQTQCGKLV